MKKIFITLLLVSLFVAPLWAQKYSVQVQNTTVKKDGEKINISFDILTDKFPSNYRIKLTPILFNGDGEFQTLDPIELVGRKRDIYYQRSGETQGNRIVVKPGSKTTQKYFTTIAYQHWMQYVSVSVEQISEGCCSQFEQPIREIASPKLLHYKVVPYFGVKPLQYELTELEKYDLDNPFLHPMEDYNKRYDILLKDRNKGTSTVIFKVGSAVIDMDFSSNSDVLESIGKAFDLIENDPNAILKNIMIAGYASPEGSLVLNSKLAIQRAAAVKKFLQSRMSKPNEEIFELYNGREDWAGLRDLVDKSEMDSKELVLQTIDAYTMEQEIRKTKLKQLEGGAPYRYMLENFYPQLRSGGYVQVYYEIDRKATVATAITDDKGRTTWIDPNSPRNRAVTTINKALESMVDLKFDEALEMLADYSDDPRAWNLIGVCYMMKGDYAQANPYFAKAVANGDTDATKNLEQTSWAQKINN